LFKKFVIHFRAELSKHFLFKKQESGLARLVSTNLLLCRVRTFTFR
jgi:hypothetical protein